MTLNDKLKNNDFKCQIEKAVLKCRKWLDTNWESGSKCQVENNDSKCQNKKVALNAWNDFIH